MTDIAFAPATRLASLIRRKKIGCLELLDHYIARVERLDLEIDQPIAPVPSPALGLLSRLERAF